MRVLITYVTVTGGNRTRFFADRFAGTLLQHPPDYEFQLLTVCNGGPPRAEDVGLLKDGCFSWFRPRENVGGDIGAFIDVAGKEGEAYNLMLCCGESVYFHRRGWLKRLVDAVSKHGPGLYGFMASRLVNPHLNTTVFSVCPPLLLGWNQSVRTKEHRYFFEHSETPFWKQVKSLGYPVKLVMWDHVEDPWEWRQRKTENEFWRGDQSQCLFFCQHTDRFRDAAKATKTRWTQNCDYGLK